MKKLTLYKPEEIGVRVALKVIRLSESFVQEGEKVGSSETIEIECAVCKKAKRKGGFRVIDVKPLYDSEQPIGTMIEVGYLYEFACSNPGCRAGFWAIYRR